MRAIDESVMAAISDAANSFSHFRFAPIIRRPTLQSARVGSLETCDTMLVPETCRLQTW